MPQLFQTSLGGGAVASACLSPREPHTALACLEAGPPVLIDVPSGATRSLPLIELTGGTGGRPYEVSVSTPAAGAPSRPPAAQQQQQQQAAAVLSRDGRLVFAAQPRGVIAVFDAQSGRVVDLVKVGAAARVLSLTLDRKGSFLLANCHDKVIRLLEVRRPGEGAEGVAPEGLAAALAAAEVRDCARCGEVRSLQDGRLS
jgi:hypothetical protein